MPVTVPNTFAALSGSISLALLDQNFSALVTGFANTLNADNSQGPTQALTWGQSLTLTAPAGQTALTINSGTSSAPVTINALAGVTSSTLVLAAPAATQTGVSWAQSGQTVWNIYQPISSQSLVLGNSATGSIGIFGTSGSVALPNIGTTASAANAFLDSGSFNNLLRSTSSIRYKRDVHTLCAERARDIIRGLRVVSYRSKAPSDDPKRVHYGLIAEEVAKLDTALVTFDAQGRPDGVQYERVAMLMLPLLQEA